MAELSDLVRVEFDAVHAAREVGLAGCRRTIRAAGSAIRAVHRRQPERAATLLAECEGALREAQAAVAPFPSLAHASFIHDAEKEFVEATLTAALIDAEPLPDWHQLGVGTPAWLHGLCEGGSELRRQILDRLRAGDVVTAERLLVAMEGAYELVVSIDYPDAITGGLRRAADALRAVLERTRSDLTTTLLQFRLQAAVEKRIPLELGGKGLG